jgi:hypothetical protein
VLRRWLGIERRAAGPLWSCEVVMCCHGIAAQYCVWQVNNITNDDDDDNLQWISM